jgi:pimeloyl-ACP methyl ester carboxylesterase
VTMPQVNFERSVLSFSKMGTGKKTLLLFHGFGQSSHVFLQHAKVLGETYTMYAFDLFFHGSSVWPMRKAVEKSDWQKIMNTFLQQERIDHFEVGGFSLGGKFALATLELFAPRIDRLILLAPDGIKTSFWYSLATYPIATRALFRSMILKPGRLHALVVILRKLHMVDNGILRFAEHQMNTEEKRRRVYYSWVYFRHLKFNLNKIAALLNGHNIPLLVITGHYDKIITTANMRGFVKKITRAQLLELQAGHNDLIGKAVGAIRQLSEGNPATI